MESIKWIIENWYIVGPIVITVASVIVKLTPTETDNEILGLVLRCAEKVALNNKPVEVKK